MEQENRILRGYNGQTLLAIDEDLDSYNRILDDVRGMNRTVGFSLKCNRNIHTYFDPYFVPVAFNPDDFVCNHKYNDVVIYRNDNGMIKAKCGKCGMEYDTLLKIAIDYERANGCCVRIKHNISDFSLMGREYMKSIHNYEEKDIPHKQYDADKEFAEHIASGYPKKLDTIQVKKTGLILHDGAMDTALNMIYHADEFYSEFPMIKPVVSTIYSTLYRRHFKWFYLH